MATVITSPEARQDLLNRFEGIPSSQQAEPFRRPPGSCLSLTKDQEEKLVQYVCEKTRELQDNSEKWNKKRKDYLDEHENNFDHRKAPGSIFEKSNTSFNQSKRNTLPIVARLTKDYLGTDEFYSVNPVRLKSDNSTLSERIQSYARFKLGRSNLKECLAESINLAAIVGERVLKVTHVEDATFYKERATVLIGPDGQPQRTSIGDVIYDNDEWIYPQVDDDDVSLLNKVVSKLLPNTPGIVQNFLGTLLPSVQKVLKKDPSVPQPQQMDFEERVYPMKKVHYSGPDHSGVHHGDFLCGLNEPDIQKAPIIIHKYDRAVQSVVEKYFIPIDPTILDPEEKLFFDDLSENLEGLQSADSTPKSDQSQAQEAKGEKVSSKRDEFNQIVQLVEAYALMDVDGDGILEEICITVDIKNKFALFYDYTPNLVPPGIRRPFRVIRITPVPDRWYGLSEYENNKHKQQFIDWCLNRMIHENSLSGMIRGYDPEAAEGWDRQVPTAGDKLYKMKNGGEKFKEGIVTITLPPLSDNTFKLMESMMQASQAERGNLSPGGDSLSNLPSSRLKYGIEAIQRSGDEIYALSAITLRPSIISVIHASLQTMLFHMEPVEEYEYTKDGTTLTDMMNKAEVEGLDFNVSIDLSLNEDDKINEANAAATEIVLQYVNLPAWQRIMVRDFLIKRLKAMDIDDAEKSLAMPSDDEIQASLQASMGQMSGTPAPGAPSGAPQPSPKPEPGAPSPEPKLI